MMRKRRLMVYIAGILFSGAVLFVAAYLFYRHIGICIAMTAFAPLFVPLYHQIAAKRRRKWMAVQFRQFLALLSSALAAGHSLENAFVSAEKELRMFNLAGGEALAEQIMLMNSKVRNGQSIERAFQAFSELSELEDIRQFAEVLIVCKRAGGNLIDVVRQAAHVIADKMEMEQDIAAMTAHKKFEAKALAVAPFAMVALLAVTSPEYMRPLYTGAGRAVMTTALVGFGLCWRWAASIMNVKV